MSRTESVGKFVGKDTGQKYSVVRIVTEISKGSLNSRETIEGTLDYKTLCGEFLNLKSKGEETLFEVVSTGELIAPA